MKRLFLVATIILIIGSVSFTFAETDKESVKRVSIAYIEGFYLGESEELINSLDPTLHKFGFWKKKGSDTYESQGFMTFDGAIKFANEIKEKKDFAKPDAPKKVEVLDVMNHIGAVKITAWWGIDYMLLSKDGDKSMIEQVIWASVPRQ